MRRPGGLFQARQKTSDWVVNGGSRFLWTLPTIEMKISKKTLVAGSGSRGMRQLHFVSGKHIMAWGGN